MPYNSLAKRTEEVEPVVKHTAYSPLKNHKSHPVHSNFMVNTLKRNPKALILVLPNLYYKSPSQVSPQCKRLHNVTHTNVTEKNKTKNIVMKEQ